MEVASTALVRLNLETRAHHGAADEIWRVLARTKPTRLDYARCLAATYGFEAPLEAALAYTPNLRSAIEVRTRSRAGLIARDLLVLGFTPEELARLPACSPMAPFSSVVEALGWMYVVERATLLHADVRQRLIWYLPDVARATSYLGAYGDVVAGRWQELGDVLARFARDDRDRAALAAAAHRGFRCLLAWHGLDRQAVARGA